MKVKNFPRRKMLRQLKANGLNPEHYENELEEARNIRTKKNREKS